MHRCSAPTRDVTRREVLGTVGTAAAGLTGASALSQPAAATHTDSTPDDVTITYDEDLIREYQPALVLKGLDPEPVAFHALHAESSASDLNVVAGFTFYSHQSGLTSADSHLGDHEPIYVFYDATTGAVEYVLYAAYHWFKARAVRDVLQFQDPHRPVFRPDVEYHHYRIYSGDREGELIETKDLTASIDGWLENGLEEELALSQPNNPYDMQGRETWWRHTRENWIDAKWLAFWFNWNLFTNVADRSDLGEVETW